MTAPQFSLPDQEQQIHTLSQYRGKWVVLYFYPKDNTTGCTKEACSFRDVNPLLKENNTVVLGISADSVSSHKKFAQSYQLPFPLLSDESKDTIRAYHAWGKKKFAGREYEGILRMTYLINPEGQIAKTYTNVNPATHAQDVVSDIRAQT
jgi:peroxiredoxin Q/BCP